MNEQAYSLIDRFKEPSSWTAFAAMLAANGFVFPSKYVQVASLIGAGLCGVAGFLLPEKPAVK